MNIFIACDGQYYSKWGENCLKSIKFHVPWVSLIVHVVNPLTENKIEGVKYFYETRDFVNESSKLGYFQAARFLYCPDYFENDDLVMTIDCDTLLTRSFSKEEFKIICEKVSVQRHQKDIRWMAGLVTYGKNNFRQRFKEELMTVPIDNWKPGWDQDVLKKLSDEFVFNKIMVGDWMSFGRGRGIFLTLKGDQKTARSYLENYNNNLIKIKN